MTHTHASMSTCSQDLQHVQSQPRWSWATNDETRRVHKCKPWYQKMARAPTRAGSIQIEKTFTTTDPQIVTGMRVARNVKLKRPFAQDVLHGTGACCMCVHWPQACLTLCVKTRDNMAPWTPAGATHTSTRLPDTLRETSRQPRGSPAIYAERRDTNVQPDVQT